ncbi:MAG: ribose 5-phosphate isomerase B [Anaerolineae bacterium]
MRIAIGSDHAGFELKSFLVENMKKVGHEILDMGTHNPEPVDFPDFTRPVCKAVLDGRAERGILVCGSGVGTSIAANKVHGIRAALCHDTYSARQSVEHNDANVLCLGGRVIGQELAREVVEVFLKARFSGLERYKRRVEKIIAMEREKR